MMIHFAFERIMLDTAGTMIWATRDEEDELAWWLMVTMPDGTDVPILCTERNTLDMIMVQIAMAASASSPYILIETEPYDHIEDQT